MILRSRLACSVEEFAAVKYCCELSTASAYVPADQQSGSLLSSDPAGISTRWERE